MANIEAMTPDEVCAWVRRRLREKLGDEIENQSTITCRRGSYYVGLPGREVVGMRRKRLAEFVKGLKREGENG